MGFLTEIVIYNDALHVFEENPAEFAKAVFEGIDTANRENHQISTGIKGYCNYIRVEKSRHADHEVMFLHSGNCLTAVGAYEQSWEELCKRNPEFARKTIETCKYLIKRAQESLNKTKEK